jgi:4-amino-4-deoxy-L-arabinose transferase-like glycosyltransferase
MAMLLESTDRPPANRVHAALLALILAGSFILKLQHLDHAAVKPLDEVFHAIVARNFLKHPLMPTLVDRDYLKTDPSNWQNAHIWMIKPPLAMWQIAISFAMFGVNTLALRLPSAILSTLAALFTYLIGREWLDPIAALVAAALQAFNPTITMLVHGYVFADHVDISLLFWTEVAIWSLSRGMRTQSSRDFLIAGVGQGLAFLSKSFPALLVSGLVVVAWGLSRRKMSGKNVLAFCIAALATALPWLIYAAIRFPVDFRYGNWVVLQHLDKDIEGWAAPWDRVVFTYGMQIFHVYYPAILAAIAIATVSAFRKRQAGLWMTLAWAAGAVIPNLFATSKTMSATLIGWPALFLLFGYLVSSALRGEAWPLGAWFVAMVIALEIKSSQIPSGGWGYPSPGSPAIWRENIWLLWQAIAIVFVGGIVAIYLRHPIARRWTIGLATVAMILLFVRFWKSPEPRGYAIVAWEVTRLDKETPNFQSIGQFARGLPQNAAFIVDENDRLENKLIEFVADRSCYPLGGQDWQSLATPLVEAGALPYLVSSHPHAMPVVFVDEEDQRTVYACTPAAESAAQAGRK